MNNKVRSAPAGPITITGDLMPWLQEKAPHLARVLQGLEAKGEKLMDSDAIFNRPWEKTPNGRNALKGWVLMADGAARINLTREGVYGWGFLYQPAFNLVDLSKLTTLMSDEFTFLIGTAAYTAYRYPDEGGRFIEAATIQAV